MPSDQYSTLLRLLEMADGNDDNTWGDNTNTNLNLLEQSIAQQTAITFPGSFSGATVTLTALDGQQDQSRCIGVVLTGTLTENVTVIVPNLARLQIFNNQATNNYSATNQAGFTVTVQTAAPVGNGAIMAAGLTPFYCDGNDAVSIVTQPSRRLALLDEYEQFQVGVAFNPIILTYGNSINIDPSLGNNFSLTLTGTPTNPLTITANNATSLPNGAAGQLDGQAINILLVQDATGSRTVTWPTNVKWPNDITPTLTAVANGADMVTLQWRAAQATWFGSIVQGYNPTGGAGSQHTINITANQVDWALAGQIPGLTGTPTVNINVLPGVIIQASSIGLCALSLANSGLPSGSTINLFISGSVIGKGGDGGDGGYLAGDASFAGGFGPTDGKHGGTAIIGPGSGYTFNLFIESGGLVAAGGGGGGGGGWTFTNPGSNIEISSGGGGAGAGSFGATGGKATKVVQGSGNAAGTAGGDSQSGKNSSAGTGGSGASAGGGTGGSGGAGGAFGQNGTAGASPTGGSSGTVAGGALGQAGWTVNNDNVTFSETILGTVSGSTYSGSGTQNYPYW